MVKINRLQIKNPSGDKKEPQQAVQNTHIVKSIKLASPIRTKANLIKNHQHRHKPRITKLVGKIDLWINPEANKNNKIEGGRLLLNAGEDRGDNQGNEGYGEEILLIFD